MTNEELAIRIQNGELGLIGELWDQNVGVIKLHAYDLFNRYRDRCASSGVEADDIYQVCFFALTDAVKAFCKDSGYKLTTYMKYPLMTHFNALTGIRTTKRDALNYADSLDEPIGDNNIDATRLDMVADLKSEQPFRAIENGDGETVQCELSDIIEKFISKLSGNRAAVIRGRWIDRKSQNEVAAELGLSKQRVSQLERDELKKLCSHKEIKNVLKGC